MTGTTYAVVGGGIVGTSVAYHLSERTDESVTLFERGSLGDETTDASMAMLGRSGDPEMARMKGYAMRRYNEFMADPVGADSLAFQPTGSVSVATTDEGAASLADRDGADRDDESGAGGDADVATDEAVDDASEPVAYYDGEAVHSSMVFPTLATEDVTGVRHEPAKGYTTPRQLAREFAARARSNGADVREGRPVEDVLVEGGAVTGLVVAGERVDADTVVCAAGPWNVELARRAGVDLPVRHSLAPILELDPPASAPHPIPYTKHHESGIYFRSTPRGTVLVGRHTTESGPFEEIERYDPDDVGPGVPASFRERVDATVERLLPWLSESEECGERLAVGSRTPDAWPVLGWTDVAGFAVAAFHSQGIQLAPAAGRILARQLVDGDPTEYYDSVSISRFDGYTDVRDD